MAEQKTKMMEPIPLDMELHASLVLMSNRILELDKRLAEVEKWCACGTGHPCKIHYRWQPPPIDAIGKYTK